MNNSQQVPTASCTVVAPSSREALRLLREKLGPDAIILSNRVTADGVEIVATLEEPVPMVTPPLVSSPPAVQPAELIAPQAAVAPFGDGDSVLREIHSMRGMIEEQLAGMAWNEKQKRDPVRGHLLRTLLGAGFSARLARDVLENLPAGQSYASGLEHAKAELARQMPILEDEDALMDAGGVYALMGPTGVGKTTTTAKLAARCVMRFGAAKLALVTTDSYRIGAYEQLRIYGQILGVSVHAVKDAVDLERVLVDLRDKHMVLIDTVGMSQRDRAVSDQIAMLCSASRPVKRLLLLNASSHGDTLNEVVQVYRHSEQKAGSTDLAGCIFTKVDEATHPGVLVDMAIRHQLPVHYISSGQKVPEHLMMVDRKALVDSVFHAKSASAWFVPGEADLEDRPAPLENTAEVAAAEAVSERLRAQCQQLIRALTDNAQELASNANSLAGGHVGFDETRALWRQLFDAQVNAEAVAQTLHGQALADSRLDCSDYVLAVAGETSLAAQHDGSAGVLASTLLMSDRTGRPFAAPQQLLAATALTAKPGMAARADWELQDRCGKPLVHLFSRVPAALLIAQWQSSGLHWAASATAALKIVPAQKGGPGTLAKLAAGLTFSSAQAAMYRKKRVWISVAQAQVRLRPDLRDLSSDSAYSSTLRCVVRRIVDADTGQALAHSYVLVSTGIQASAQQIAQWPGWRASAEPYFKLLKQGILQVGGGVPYDTDMRKRLLIAGQASATVFRLHYVQDAWADAARRALAQLVGRSVRPDRAVPGPVLLEGLGKLFVLLDALETEGGALAPQSHPALAKA